MDLLFLSCTVTQGDKQGQAACGQCPELPVLTTGPHTLCEAFNVPYQVLSTAL